MKKALVIFSAAILLSGCATAVDTAKKTFVSTPVEVYKLFIGTSTKEVEKTRKNALVKVFDYDYKTCYSKVEALLKAMPRTSVYTKSKSMIAVYYTDPCNTPVGVFFKETDPSHTQVEVSSPAPFAKEWVAKNVFSETILPQTEEAEKY